MIMFQRQIDFIDNIPNVIFLMFKKAIEDNGFELKEYLTEDQLYEQGIDGTGKKLRGYKRTTIVYKLSKGQPADRTTLKDTGEFHGSIEIKAFEDHFKIESNVNYDKYIIASYSKNVLKITDENMKRFIKDHLFKNIRNYASNNQTTG